MVIKKLIGFITCSLLTTGLYAQMPVEPPGPRALVYKTRKDYSNNVSIILAEDGKRIISFITPQELRDMGHTPTPLKLHKGYLLDTRGIGRYHAILKLKWVQYAALRQTPTEEQLLDMIIDRHPMTQLYDCNNIKLMKEPVKELNKLIDKKQLGKACKLIQ